MNALLREPALSAILAVRDSVRLHEAGSTEVAVSGGRCGIVSEELAVLGYGQEMYGAYRTDAGLIDHAWVILPGGDILDATRDQFGETPGVRVLQPGDPELARYVTDYEDAELIG